MVADQFALACLRLRAMGDGLLHFVLLSCMSMMRFPPAWKFSSQVRPWLRLAISLDSFQAPIFQFFVPRSTSSHILARAAVELLVILVILGMPRDSMGVRGDSKGFVLVILVILCACACACDCDCERNRILSAKMMGWMCNYQRSRWLAASSGYLGHPRIQSRVFGWSCNCYLGWYCKL